VQIYGRSIPVLALQLLPDGSLTVYVCVCVSVCCATCCSVPTAGPNTGTRKTDTEWSEIHRNYTKYDDEDEKSADALKRAEADWAEEYAKGVAADAKVKRRYTVGVLVGSVTPFWGTLQAIMTADSDAYAADKVLQVRHDDLIISLHCSPVSEGGPLLWIESLGYVPVVPVKCFRFVPSLRFEAVSHCLRACAGRPRRVAVWRPDCWREVADEAR
jgi:hypothetical protein